MNYYLFAMREVPHFLAKNIIYGAKISQRISQPRAVIHSDGQSITPPLIDFCSALLKAFPKFKNCFFIIKKFIIIFALNI